MLFVHGFDLGIYDPDGLMVSETVFATEGNVFDWTGAGYDAAAVTAWLTAAAGRNRVPLLTVRPVAAPGNDATLLTDIVAGAYDSVLSNLTGAINAATFAAGKRLYLRWGPEMDVVTGVNPWAVAPSIASTYGAAYDYVTNYFRQHITATPVSTVWSPAGDSSDAKLYYPSDVSVDLVGTTVKEWTLLSLDYGFGKPKTPGLYWDSKGFRSFSSILTDKLPNISFPNKSIVVAEAGVSTTGVGTDGGNFGTKTYQREWMYEGFEALKRGDFPLIMSLVYYNVTDLPNSWMPYETSAPDFHISADVFRSWLGQ
jgi:beta-mannanase